MEINIADVFPGETVEPLPPPSPLQRRYGPTEIAAITGINVRQIARLSARRLILEDDYAPGNRPRYRCEKIFLFRIWQMLRARDLGKKQLFSYGRSVTLLKRIATFLAPYRGHFAHCQLLIEANALRRRPKILLVQGEAKFEDGDNDWWMINLHLIVEEIAQYCLAMQENEGIVSS